MKRFIKHKGQFVHVYNRGIERRSIFESDLERKFFLVRMNEYRIGINGELDVNIHAYCLMGNHFHLLLEQVSEQGIAKFMHRLCSSYVRFFNKNNERKGRLFESEYQSVSVDRSGQLEHIIRYIHLNPVQHLIEDIGCS